jgi:hypothetical protein
VRFKQNLPLLILGLCAAAFVVFVIVLAPSEEDLLREAVTAHVKTVPDVLEWVVHGDTADVQVKDGRVLRFLFEKRDGTWRYSKDLNKEFVEGMADPGLHREVGERLGRRLSQRTGGNVRVREGMEYQYALERDEKGLVGTMTLLFAYPDSGLRGRYVERFRREKGRWESQGLGSLFDTAPPPKAK